MLNPSTPKSGDAEKRPRERCSFCLKDYTLVGPLIQPPNQGESGAVNICRECVELCSSIFEREKTRIEALREEAATSQSNHPPLPQAMEEFLKPLTDGEREIVKLRSGLATGYNHTLEEVRRRLKMTPDDVREIESRAHIKLQSQNQCPMTS